MDNFTQLATARLTSAQTYALHAQKVRRDAAIERQRQDIQADLNRLADLYKNGSLKRAQPAPAPAFNSATSYTVTKLAGGAALSGRKGRSAKDTSPEAEAKRERRRARRAARRQQKVAQ
jgi:hypothetical protein